MEWLDSLQRGVWVDALGWIAAVLTLTTFSMRTMIPLRLVAISSNAFFIAYGALSGFFPVLALHCVLLPFNIYRTYEMLRLTRQVKAAADGDLSVEWLKPFMVSERCRAGRTLFSQGDWADKLYLLVSGRIRLPEIDETMESGALFGEIAFFAPEKTRTLTALCETDCELLSLNESQLKQLYYQNPRFGFFLIRLVAARLLADSRRMQGRA